LILLRGWLAIVLADTIPELFGRLITFNELAGPPVDDRSQNKRRPLVRLSG
jgi:hypothetical protein